MTTKLTPVESFIGEQQPAIVVYIYMYYNGFIGGGLSPFQPSTPPPPSMSELMPQWSIPITWAGPEEANISGTCYAFNFPFIRRNSPRVGLTKFPMKTDLF